MEETRRYIIVGLGNPGREYVENRHNVGFRVVDKLAEKHGLKFNKMMNKGIVALGEIGSCKVALVKPQTFMNLSGECVAPILKFFKSQLSELVVIYDELDLSLAQLRLRKQGSAGGHNGMKSIIAKLGSQDFPRLRFGIGRPPGRQDPVDYVLNDFTSIELIQVNDALDRSTTIVLAWLNEGIEKAMNVANASVEKDGKN
jgi:PTH1 family peptidyl-tRNA hydrolase